MIRNNIFPNFSPDEGGNAGGTVETAAPGGNTQVSFFDSLPDDVKGNEAFSTYKEMQPADLVKQHAELSGKVQDAIIPPGENATDDEKKAFSERMRQINQVPEKVEGYAAALKLPEGIPANDPMLVSVLNRAHQAGLGPAQVQATVDGFMDFIAASEKEAKAALARDIDALKIEQGVKYDEYLKNSENAMRELGIEAGFRPEEVQSMIDQTGLKNNMMFIRMFNKASRFFAEGKIKGEGGGTDTRTFAQKMYPDLPSGNS